MGLAGAFGFIRNLDPRNRILGVGESLVARVFEDAAKQKLPFDSSYLAATAGFSTAVFRSSAAIIR